MTWYEHKNMHLEFCPGTDVTNSTFKHLKHWPVSASHCSTTGLVSLKSSTPFGNLQGFFHFCTYRYILLLYITFCLEAPLPSTGLYCGSLSTFQLQEMGHSFLLHVFLVKKRKESFPWLNQRTELRNARNQLCHPSWPIYKRWFRKKEGKSFFWLKHWN